VQPPSALFTPSSLARIALAMAKARTRGSSSGGVSAPIPPTKDLAAA